MRDDPSNEHVHPGANLNQRAASKIAKKKKIVRRDTGIPLCDERVNAIREKLLSTVFVTVFDPTLRQRVCV